MIYSLERYTAENFSEIEKLFYEVFGHNQDLDRIDLKKKLDTSYTNISDIMVMARTEDGSLAGALGIYPVLMKIGDEIIKAGQIGDAMVYSYHRGKGLFSKMILKLIDISKTEEIDLIYTLPSVNNKGSYKGFQKSNFDEVDNLCIYSLSVKATLLPRILRKINYKLYEFYCSSLLKKCNFQNAVYKPKSAQDFISVIRNEDYIQYKKFNANDFYEFKTAYAWLNIGKFDIKIADFQLKANAGFDDFVAELKKCSAILGKDNLVLLQNENYTKSLNSFSEVHFQKDDNIRLMVFYVNEKLKNIRFIMNFADSDTF